MVKEQLNVHAKLSLETALSQQQDAEYILAIGNLFDYYHYRIGGADQPTPYSDSEAFNLGADLMNALEGK